MVSTIFSQDMSAGGNGADFEWNQDVVISFTPITPDGNVLTVAEAEDYIKGLLSQFTSVEDVMNADKA